MRMKYLTALLAIGIGLTILLSTSSALGYDPQWDNRYTAADNIVGSIDNFAIQLGSNVAGALNKYSVKFTFTGDSLRSNSRIEIDFPPYMAPVDVDSVHYSDNDLSADFTIESFTTDNNRLSVQLGELDPVPGPGNRIAIDIFLVRNPEVIGDYKFLLTLVSEDNQLLAMPKLSDAFTIVAAAPALIDLTPAGIQQVRAGSTLHFNVAIKDVHNNLITVPANQITWGVVGVPQAAGVVFDGDFQAQHVGASRITASYQSLSDTSGLVYVLPGTFAYFGFTGGADSAVAGVAWKDGDEDVVITAFDLFGNIDYEFEGQVYFSSSDPLAQLPYDQVSPLTILESDQGLKVVSGSEFKFFTAGRQQLNLVMNGTVQKVISPIAIRPAGIDQFDISIQSTTIAGDDLGVSISNAVDEWGNAITGLASVIAVGNAAAPSGALPSLPAFSIVDGVGNGIIRLVKAGSQTIEISVSGSKIQRVVTVAPDDAYRFRFELDAIQAINQPFFGTARITALDQYDNVDTSFNAFTDTVIVTPNGQGSVFAGVIGNSTAFSAGVANLGGLGTGYNGNEPYISFTARSKSGVTGISPTVGFSLLKISSGQLLQSTRYVGENFTFSLRISNFGSQPASISAIRLYGDGDRIVPIGINPTLPATIPALTNSEFTLTGQVPDLPRETLSLDAVFVGSIAGGTVTDSATALAQLTILLTEGISIIPSSLLPRQVSTGKAYQFVVRVRNDSDDDLLLSTSTTISIPLVGAPTQVAQLRSPAVVPSGGGDVLLEFVTLDFPNVSAQSVTDVGLHLIGTLGTANFDQVLSSFDGITVQTPPQISYRVGTLTPTLVFRGADALFSLRVRNTGAATLDVETQSAELTIFAGDRQLITRLNSTELDIAPGDTILHFKPVFVPTDFPLENDSIVVSLRGSANGYEESFRFSINGDVVSIPFGAAVRLVSLTTNALNNPYVNVGQAFSLSATIRNSGDEDLADIFVGLSSNGSSEFEAQRKIDFLAVGRDTVINFPVESSFTPNASEVFTVKVDSARGDESGLAALVQAPLGNDTRAIVIQSPALLNLDARVYSPPQALDGVVGLGDSLYLSSLVNNIGQAATGAGVVTLTMLKGNFIIDDETAQTLSVGVRDFWKLTAPSEDDTGLFEIKISEVPLDQNTGLASRIEDEADTIMVVSTVSQVSMTVDFHPVASQLLSAGGSYDLIDLDFAVFNQASNPYMNFIEFEIRDREDQVVDPTSVLASATLRFNGGNPINAVKTGDAMRFTLGAGFGTPQSARISVQLAQSPALSDFTFHMDSLSFSASYQTAVGARPVPVTAAFSQTLLIQQKFTLVPSGLTESFFSYPNPFSPVRQEATIVYNLSSAKPATLTIYTLTGDEVLKKEIPAPASTAEPIQIKWDGRNGDGKIVLNGVYIAVLAVDGEAEIRTKIAVVK